MTESDRQDIYVLVGIAACGKTTHCIQRFGQPGLDDGYVYLSANAIRLELYNAPVEGDGAKVFNIMYGRFLQAVRDPKVHTIALDNTHLRADARMRYFNMISEHGDFSRHCLHLLYFPPDLERSKRWNQERARQVPEEVLENQFRKIMPPQPEEVSVFSVEAVVVEEELLDV